MGERQRRLNPLEPVLARGNEANAGEVTASGCTAEQTSCVKPGSVSGSDRVPPPMVELTSSRTVFTPAFARQMAAVSPLGPEPMTYPTRDLVGMLAAIPAAIRLSYRSASPLASAHHEKQDRRAT